MVKNTIGMLRIISLIKVFIERQYMLGTEQMLEIPEKICIVYWK